MIIVVTGSRNWTDKNLIVQRLGQLPDDTLIIEGGARGVDTLAREAALELGFKHHREPADWNKYGKAAGPIRNTKMLAMNPHLVIAFHDNIQHSKGTKNCIIQARKLKIPFEIISHDF